MSFQLPVAVKLLDREATNDHAARRRFMGEARLLAALDHPNIVRVLDAGAHRGRLFYVMEYVRGLSLIRVFAHQNRLLPLDVSLFIGIRVAQALQAAHQAVDERGIPLRIVHRDVNPTNILLGFGGTVKVVDFGIATSAISPRETRINVVKGNPRYLAPEQAFGLEADRRADIYALGLTLYEAITGLAPLAAESHRVSLALAREPEIEPPSQLRPSVPAALDRAIMKTLARDPAQRFPSMEALARALQGVLGQLNPSFLPESLDLLLAGAPLPNLVPPSQGTARIAVRTAAPDLEREATSVYRRGDRNGPPDRFRNNRSGSPPAPRSPVVSGPIADDSMDDTVIDGEPTAVGPAAEPESG
jgi:serine/threonine-protein kinase